MDLEQKKLEVAVQGLEMLLLSGAQLAKWFSAWSNNPHTMRVLARIQHGAKEQ